jgi:hypothetical protein
VSTPRRSAATKQSATEAACSVDKPLPVKTAAAKARALAGEILPLRWAASCCGASITFWVMTGICGGTLKDLSLMFLAESDDNL